MKCISSSILMKADNTYKCSNVKSLPWAERSNPMEYFVDLKKTEISILKSDYNHLCHNFNDLIVDTSRWYNIKNFSHGTRNRISVTNIEFVVLIEYGIRSCWGRGSYFHYLHLIIAYSIPRKVILCDSSRELFMFYGKSFTVWS